MICYFYYEQSSFNEQDVKRRLQEFKTKAAVPVAANTQAFTRPELPSTAFSSRSSLTATAPAVRPSQTGGVNAQSIRLPTSDQPGLAVTSRLLQAPLAAVGLAAAATTSSASVSSTNLSGKRTRNVQDSLMNFSRSEFGFAKTVRTQEPPNIQQMGPNRARISNRQPVAPSQAESRVRPPTASSASSGAQDDELEDSDYGAPSDAEEDLRGNAGTDVDSVFSSSDAEELEAKQDMLFCQPVGQRKRDCGKPKCREHDPSVISKSEKMRDFANSISHETLANWGKCNSECMYGRNCVGRVSNEATWTLRRTFWNHPTKAAPLPKERKEKMTNIHDIYKAKPHEIEVRYQFAIDVRHQLS